MIHHPTTRVTCYTYESNNIAGQKPAETDGLTLQPDIYLTLVYDFIYIKTFTSNGHRTCNREKKKTTADIGARPGIHCVGLAFCATGMHTKYEVNMFDSWQALHDGILHLCPISSPEVHCSQEFPTLFSLTWCHLAVNKMEDSRMLLMKWQYKLIRQCPLSEGSVVKTHQY